MLPTIKKLQAWAESIQPFLTVLLLLFALTTSAATENLLVVSASLVNVREYPATTAPILIKLSEGRVVTEIQRQQNWIEIRIDNAVIESGWVHQEFLSPLPLIATNEVELLTVDSSRFENFIEKFEILNAGTQEHVGFIPFSKAEQSGVDTVTVTATPDWFKATRIQRQDILSAVFNLWSDAVEAGISITVQVLDENNEYHMVMFR